jgi:hypothetical protein
MQNDDQSGYWLEVLRYVREHPQIARIGPESRVFNEGAVERLPGTPSEISQAIDSINFWKASQEFDILGERHRQLLVGDSIPPRPDSCCTAK